MHLAEHRIVVGWMLPFLDCYPEIDNLAEVGRKPCHVMSGTNAALELAAFLAFAIRFPDIRPPCRIRVLMRCVATLRLDGPTSLDAHT